MNSCDPGSVHLTSDLALFAGKPYRLLPEPPHLLVSELRGRATNFSTRLLNHLECHDNLPSVRWTLRNKVQLLPRNTPLRTNNPIWLRLGLEF